jgi:Zn-dependent protease
LKRLAADAGDSMRAGDLDNARTHWTTALGFLPAHSRQHAIVRDQIADLNQRIATSTRDDPRVTDKTAATRWRGFGGLAAVALFAVTKLKFLLLGLTKASTFVSMFAFFGVYWSLYGWPLALGLAVSIYIHEMGHVAMLRKFGIDSNAPLFIPGVGAFVMLKEHVSDRLTNAKIGLAGPVWGLGAAVAALAIYAATGSQIWLAIAQLTGFLNLFNLIPVWQLDGARGIHVLDGSERWMLVGAMVLMLFLTGQRLLIVVAAVAVWRAVQRDPGPGDKAVLATFVGLVGALSLIARAVG